MAASPRPSELVGADGYARRAGNSFFDGVLVRALFVVPEGMTGVLIMRDRVWSHDGRPFAEDGDHMITRSRDRHKAPGGNHFEPMRWIPFVDGLLGFEKVHWRVYTVDRSGPKSPTEVPAIFADHGEPVLGLIAISEEMQKPFGQETYMFRYANIAVLGTGTTKWRSIGESGSNTEESTWSKMRKQCV